MNEHINIKETRDEDFMADVIDRSGQMPVVVDFWADWCQPCRMIAPLLAELAAEYDGQVAVVKANTEYCAQAAGEFGVQGIPVFFGVVDGQIADKVEGADIGALKEMFQRLTQFGEVTAAKALEESQPQQAIEAYQAILSKEPENVSAKVGIGRASLSAGDHAAAAKVIEELEQRGFLEPEAQHLKSQLTLAGSAPSVDLTELESKAQANPEDSAAALDYARGLAAAGQHEKALEHSIVLLERVKAPGAPAPVKGELDAGDEARKLMIDIFNTLPEDSPLTSGYRRKLAMLLY